MVNQSNRSRIMRVEELMTRSVRTCRVQDMLDAPARAMWDGDIGCVPVVDETSRVVGIVTDRDVCMAAYTQGRPLAAIAVSTAMASAVLSVLPHEELAAAERMMQKNQLRRLPVVDEGGRLVGIVTLGDLARHAATERANTTRKVGADEVAVTLAAICAPRAGAHRASASASGSAAGSAAGSGTGSAAGSTAKAAAPPAAPAPGKRGGGRSKTQGG